MAAALLALCACQESMTDRAAREASEFTERHCPTPYVQNERTDSMTFDKAKKTFTYYRRLRDIADNREVIAAQRSNLREALRRSVENNPSVKNYRKENFHFRFVYRSDSTGETLLDESF